ncbi:MAG: hypothetical protein COA93_00810 [Alphaproteobacteria bacterium]|nr:MAG: hypothetical protein COA93_00810 [Alphaproteobacteria bacterium]
MASGLLPEHIGPLVDRLRAGDHQSVSLPDVAALTEVLMRSLESYFKSIDLTIYAECQSLADYIDDARIEISSLSPENSDTVGIPRAGLELEAIVQQTESATNTIMESAEQIMEADPSDLEAYTTTVNDSVMQIFEACSFQDITGQRISKVVSTLQHVEDRVSKLINILGVADKPQENQEINKEEVDEDAALLNGPALEGEGIDQSEIDDLLNGPAEVDAGAEPEVEIETVEIDDTNDIKPDPAAAPEAQEPIAATDEITSADDIDFMFDGQAAETPEIETKPEPEVEPEAEQPAAEVVEAVPEAKAAPAVEPAVEAVKKDPAPVKDEPNLIEQAKLKKEQAIAEKKAKTTPPKPIAYEEDSKAGLSPKLSENTTQSDIDALFS